MHRRDLLLLLAGLMTAARALLAQQKAMPVIGFLGSGSPGPVRAPYLTAFRQGLSETAYIEGQNLAIEYRWAEGSSDRLPALASDLVGRKVDVIVTQGGTLPALAAKTATVTIPIVFTGGDPVEHGLVASFARPGGNLTGFTFFLVELVPKRLELLLELVPQARVIALLLNPRSPSSWLEHVQKAARTRGVELPYPEGRHRKRNRRRLCLPRRAARGRAPHRARSVLQRQARTAGGAGVTPGACDEL
jgi:putative ABC transport system substrate-binding protein